MQECQGPPFCSLLRFFFVISTSRGIMVGRGEGSGGAFYPFDFKRRDDYRSRIFSSTYVMHLFCFFLWSMVCIEWNELVKYCFLSDFLPSPLYQAIMENPLVQLSLNNARILGGMYILKNLGIQLCSILPCVSSVLVTKRSKCDHKQEHETSCM